MKKLLMVLALVLLAVIQVEAQKTVTYTFKGRAKGFLLPAKPLDLVPSGDIPAGVTVSNFFITKDDDDNDVENAYNDEDRIEDVEMDGFLGSALLTEYVVEPQTTAHVHFDGFRYEIVGVKWNRCSEIAVLTSKGQTWVRSWDDTTMGSWTFDTTGEEGYSTGGELFYHTRDFLSSTTGGNPTYPFTGIQSVNIDCTSKLPQHGIAVKNFKISYYEPVITITGNETVIATVGNTNTIGATITAHQGAFTNAEIKYKSLNESIATVSGSGTSAIVTGVDNGKTTIIAYIEYGEEQITKAQYTVRVGEEPEWEWSRDASVYSEYREPTTGWGASANNQNTVKWLNNETDYLHIEESDQRRFSDIKDDLNKNIISSLKDNIPEDQPSNERGVDFRAGVQLVYYTQLVPKYTTVSVAHLIKVAYDRKNLGKAAIVGTTNTNNDQTGSALIYLGETKGSNIDDMIWPDTREFYTGNATYTSNNASASNLQEYDINRASWANDQSQENRSTQRDYTFSFDNSVINDVTRYKKHMVNLVYHRRKNTDAARYTVTVSNEISATNRQATYTYYAYLKYDGNEGTGSVTNGTGVAAMPTGAHNTTDPSDDAQTISFAAKPNQKVVPDNDIMSAPESSREATKLKKNSFTKTNTGGKECKFLGWATSQENADALIVDYMDEQEFNPYKVEDESGWGPVTLYAVWQDPDATYPDEVDPDDDDILVYAVMGNGGTISGNDRIENTFKKGETAPTSFPVAVRTDWKFEGYYDSGVTTEGEVQLYDEDGNITAEAYNSDYISTTGKWSSNSDVLLYAHWTRVVAAVTHEITFNPNGGTLGTTKRTVTVGESDYNNVSDIVPTRTGYKFIGWYTATTGGDLCYNANGESVELESITKDPLTGTTINYRAVNPEFFGTDLKYKGATSPFNGNFTLYAQWMPESTKIAFHEGTTSANSAAYKLADVAISTPESEAGKMSSPDYTETEYSEVILTRALKDDNWNTICFPCFLSKEQTALLFKHVKQYKELECSSSDAVMKFKESNAIIPGIPYFVQLKEGYPTTDNGKAWISTNGTLKDIHVKASEVSKHPTSLTYSSDGVTVSMVGEFNTHLHIQAGDYYLQNDKFFISGNTYDGKEIWGNNKGFRCYFTQSGTYTGSDSRLRMHIDLEGYDGWTGDGVEEVETEESINLSSAIYDLSGRRLAKAPRQGIYIMDGKKFIIK